MRWRLLELALTAAAALAGCALLYVTHLDRTPNFFALWAGVLAGRVLTRGDEP